MSENCDTTTPLVKDKEVNNISLLSNAPSSSTDTIGIPRHNSISKSSERKISKYYDKQKELLEAFKEDEEQIQKSNRRRHISACSGTLEQQTFKEEDKLLPNCPVKTSTDNGNCLKTSSNNSSRKSSQEIVPAVTCYHANDTSDDDSKREDKAAKRLAFITLIVNITLLIIKAIASYLSGSFSIISSFVDSAVDITSGLVIWLTVRAIKKRDPYLYPRGRTRLEPLALIIVSVIMGVASLQMIIQSLKSIIEKSIDPHVGFISAGIMISTIIIKFILVIVCQRFKGNASIDVLAQDHRNDCISNFVALLCAVGSRYLWIYLDPIGAIIVSLYIAYTWFSTGKEQMKILSGRSASPDFINRIIKICLDHDDRINFIDTVYVYHFGTKFLVEVHVVLDENMLLKEAHDISEALQINIEALNDVERAFVHCDYEYDHSPTIEHKVV
ncbi:Cation efflux protein family and Cation efflux protein transmembrane domain and Cation efflux protein cytoplasmic domain-containing protein [Strongyloides ratti]|uniref:Cation efflux protein family and Cation efflux protein transmembrane domain and Cation efflux protein cytoplasmic domain-containing protein n=1 Tax=Strongyloides ratti TaxID=34506 RepID=A0A090LF88_STRRB|nr:Cation efflux protein family and Cation efflux protein transmembrane domain and Cation efflux protein cytoplasmic domain-containing protein [Strongyloides ratti]CEF68461.1 Cation efflux protein family and Cation efflux protein transmembrane domain and Cation efflux protein cytoplasmic domain-containing protein [Strongyloides ratti]